jgi:hypothetical protein
MKRTPRSADKRLFRVTGTDQGLDIEPPAHVSMSWARLKRLLAGVGGVAVAAGTVLAKYYGLL